MEGLKHKLSSVYDNVEVSDNSVSVDFAHNLHFCAEYDTTSNSYVLHLMDSECEVTIIRVTNDNIEFALDEFHSQYSMYCDKIKQLRRILADKTTNLLEIN